MIVQPFADAEGLVADYLRGRVPDFPEEWSSVEVAEESFPDRDPGEPPRLSVRCEDAGGEYPITQTSLVRVSAWTDDRDGAKALAQLAHAALLEHAGDADVIAVRQEAAVVAGFDPEVPEPNAAFSVLVTQRPR